MGFKQVVTYVTSPAILAGLWRMAAVIIGGYLLIKLSDAAIGRTFRRHGEDGVVSSRERRMQTILVLARNIIRYSVDVAVVIALLEVLGVPYQPVLAGAGIVGLAVGFGAQSLVKDVISGFFLVVEDQFGVGDYITAAGVSGVVEEMGLRVTRLRDFSGDFHTIPNGIIDKTTNHSRGPMRAMVDIGIAHEEDVDAVLEILNRLVGDFATKHAAKLVEGPTVLGVVNIGPSDIVIRLIAKAQPMMQWEVERELRREIKVAFDEAGIEIPYNRQVLVPAEQTKIGARSGKRPKRAGDSANQEGQ